MGFVGEELEPVTPGERVAFAALKAAKTVASATGYGGDPNLITPVRPWPLTLSAAQRDTLAALSDILLPSSSPYEAPSRLNIAEFFDEWLSAPYPRQVDDNALLLSGLAALDADAQQTYGAVFTALAEAEKAALVAALSQSTGMSRQFFVRLRYLAVGGYFTSDVGMTILGYRGNVPLNAFPPVSAAALQIIDEQLALLGLAREA